VDIQSREGFLLKQKNKTSKETHPSSRGSCAELWKEGVPGRVMGERSRCCATSYQAEPVGRRVGGEWLLVGCGWLLAFLPEMVGGGLVGGCWIP